MAGAEPCQASTQDHEPSIISLLNVTDTSISPAGTSRMPDTGSVLITTGGLPSIVLSAAWAAKATTPSIDTSPALNSLRMAGTPDSDLNLGRDEARASGPAHRLVPRRHR